MQVTSAEINITIKTNNTLYNEFNEHSIFPFHSLIPNTYTYKKAINEKLIKSNNNDNNKSISHRIDSELLLRKDKAP